MINYTLFSRLNAGPGVNAGFNKTLSDKVEFLINAPSVYSRFRRLLEFRDCLTDCYADFLYRHIKFVTFIIPGVASSHTLYYFRAFKRTMHVKVIIV